MKIRTLLLALMLGLSTAATANFELVSKAHEVSLGDLRLPGSSSGTLSFKPCADCSYETVRVTTTTRYEVNQQSLELADFREQLADIRNRQDAAVTVVHHLESNTIKAIRVQF